MNKNNDPATLRSRRMVSLSSKDAETPFARQDALTAAFQIVKDRMALLGVEEHFLLIRRGEFEEEHVLRDGGAAFKVSLSRVVGVVMETREFGGSVRIAQEFSEGADMMTVGQAADYLGMSLSAMRARIATARRRGEWEPFKRFTGRGGALLLVERGALDRWVLTWEGRRKKRPRRR